MFAGYPWQVQKLVKSVKSDEKLFEVVHEVDIMM
jgi:hypothetical protein